MNSITSDITMSTTLASNDMLVDIVATPDASSNAFSLYHEKQPTAITNTTRLLVSHRLRALDTTLCNTLAVMHPTYIVDVVTTST